MLPPVTNVPNAWITSPASPLARISLVDAIESTSLNIVPIRIIEGKDANSRVFRTYKDIIKSTTPRVIFKQIETFTTQLGNSTSKRTINSKTNIAIATSLKFVPPAEPCACAIILLSMPP